MRFFPSRKLFQTMKEEGRRAAKLALSLRQNPQRLLSTILIGNNVVNLTAAALVSMVALEHFGSEAVAIATGALTVFVLIFGEIVPKTCAPNTRLPPSNFSRISSIGRKSSLLRLYSCWNR